MMLFPLCHDLLQGVTYKGVNGGYDTGVSPP